MTQGWTPFRPSSDDLVRIAAEVGTIPEIQEALTAAHPDLKMRDRVAHQYQIAGGRVVLSVASQLPDALAGLGLFEASAECAGIGRISTGLGCPHAETDPDFLGLMLAFQTPAGARVDFLAINDPTSPTDSHPDFIALLAATAAAAGAKSIFGNSEEQPRLTDLVATNVQVVSHLVKLLGVLRGTEVGLHVLRQTWRTARSSSAYQTYWTGIVEAEGTAGKFVIAPEFPDQNPHRAAGAGPLHLTEDWRARQARGEVTFELLWIPFIDQQETSTTELTKAWEERRQLVGRVTFPRQDFADTNAALWAMLAAEMGANPANWIADRAGAIREPSTDFVVARKFAYRKSQDGRGALPEAAYSQVFRTGKIDDDLAAELKRRHAVKAALAHVSAAP